LVQVVQLSQTNITGVKTESEGRAGHALFKRALGKALNVSHSETACVLYLAYGRVQMQYLFNF
jgi:hypothetical protein